MNSARFRTAAAHYTLGRPTYPADLIAGVALACGLNPSDRLLDLGTGPGVLALAFAPYVSWVLAVDPEPEMLRQAQEAVRLAHARVEVRAGSSETLGPEWGRFRAVTMGRSFHWMDREETLRRLDLLVEPNGTVALFNDEIAELPENAAVLAWSAVVERYSADDRVRAERRSPEWQKHEVVLRHSPFRSVERLVQRHRAPISEEQLVHRALSMSATSSSRLGPRVETMVAEIREALAPFAVTGELTECNEWTVLLARRPAPGRLSG